MTKSSHCFENSKHILLLTLFLDLTGEAHISN